MRGIRSRNRNNLKYFKISYYHHTKRKILLVLLWRIYSDEELNVRCLGLQPDVLANLATDRSLGNNLLIVRKALCSKNLLLIHWSMLSVSCKYLVGKPFYQLLYNLLTGTPPFTCQDCKDLLYFSYSKTIFISLGVFVQSQNNIRKNLIIKLP